MTLKWQALEGQQIVAYNAPAIEQLMTGVNRAMQDKDGLITLFYEDGTRESADGSDRQLSEAATLMRVTGFVQALAREGVRIGADTWAGEPVSSPYELEPAE